MRLSNKWLYIIILGLPTYLIRWHLFSVPITVLEILIIIGFILLCVEYRCRLTLGYWKYIMAAFAIIGLIAVFVSGETTAALGLYKAYIIEPMLVGMIVLTTKPKLEHVLTVLSSVVVLIGLTCLIQLFTGYGIPAPWHDYGTQFRTTSWFGYPNAVGLLCAPIMALLIAYLVQNKRPINKLYFMAIIFGIISIILSRTAGAVLAVAGATMVSIWFTQYKKIALIITTIVIAVVVSLPTTRQLLLFQDVSGQVRLALWQGTLNLLAHRPWFGAGLANFPLVYAEYKLARHTELLLYPHNIFLDFWVELGLAGLIWLVGILGWFFYNLLQQKTKSAKMLIVAMVSILIYGLVDVPYFKNDLAVLFWLIITLGGINLASKNPSD